MPQTKGEFSSQTLWKLYRETFSGTFEINAPKWNIKDWKNWCRLIDEIGIDKTNLLSQFVISNWEKVKLKFRINGYPTISVLWCWRHSLLDYMNERVKVGNGNSNTRKKEQSTNSSKKLFLSQ